jgi:hypothetical protein
MHPRYPLYIAPKEDHLFVIGATEIESDDMSPASVRSTLELLSALHRALRLCRGRIVEIATQCRPTLPDNLPAVRCWMSALQVNGLYRHGFMISPAMLDVVLQVLRSGAPTGPQFDVAVHLPHTAPEPPPSGLSLARASPPPRVNPWWIFAFLPCLRAMKITINQQSTELPAHATVADALAQCRPSPLCRGGQHRLCAPWPLCRPCAGRGRQVEVILP